MQIGFHALDVEPVTAPLDKEGIVALDLFGRGLSGWAPSYPYVLLGLGAYVSKRTEGGVAGTEYSSWAQAWRRRSRSQWR